MEKLFDTHTHVNFQPFSADYKTVLQKAIDAGITINNIGSQWESSQRSVQIAEEFEHGIWASVGLHPIHLFSDVIEQQTIAGKVQNIRTRAEIFDYERYKQLAQSSKKVIAIGECGLDYYHFEREHLQAEREPLIEQQKQTLRQHFDLALELNLPVSIHCRDAATHNEDTLEAFEDLLALLKEYNGNIKGSIHCYTGIPKYIPYFLELGLHIGYTGIVSFKNTAEVQASLKVTPLEQVLLETDAPYLAPHPYRGHRNEPFYLQHVAEAVAKVKDLSIQEVAEQTTLNAERLFLKK